VNLLDVTADASASALDGLYDLAIGRTAVGTGSTPIPNFAERAARKF